MEYIPCKTIVTKTKNTQWFGSDYNMNIYRGCCHGCIYCDSRSDCYRIDDFDTVKAKENALEIIRNDLCRKIKPGVVATGAMSDPYNPFERELLLTRHSLELINAYNFGVSITTKSALVTRDIDVLQDIKQHSPVIALITITCADDKLCKIIEPNSDVSSLRFEALRKLSEAGIFCGVFLMPVLPYINDYPENISSIVSKVFESGTKFIYPAFGVTLRQNQREYFYQRLDELFPGLKPKYISDFGDRYNCSSKNAKKLYNIFEKQCKESGLFYKMSSITEAYKRGYGDNQLSFF